MATENETLETPSTETLEQQNADAQAGVAAAVESSISKLIDQINAGTMKMQEINTRPPTAHVSAPAGPPLITKESLTQLANDKGVGEAFAAFAEGVLVPQMAANLAGDAARTRRDLERDPVLGEVAKKNKGAIDKYLADHKLGDAFVVQYGVEDVLKAVDPKGFVEATEKKSAPAPRSALGTTDGGSKSLGVQKGPITPPTPQQASRDDAINKMEVTADEKTALGTYFGMDERDIKTQKFEIADWEKRLAPAGGFQVVGGIPICNLQEVMPRRTNPDGTKGDYIVRIKEEF